MGGVSRVFVWLLIINEYFFSHFHILIRLCVDIFFCDDFHLKLLLNAALVIDSFFRRRFLQQSYSIQNHYVYDHFWRDPCELVERTFV